MIPSTTVLNKNKIYKFLRTLAATVVWIGVWWVAALCINRQIVLPTPYEVALAFVRMGGTADFWKSVGLSFLRVIVGFAAGSLSGIILAVFSSKYKLVNDLLVPVIGVLRAAPVASFIILALVWFKSNILAAVMAAVMVLPMVYSQTLAAIKGIDLKLVEVGQVFGLKKSHIFWKIKVRSVLPAVIGACASALGFAWKAGVAAEVICHPKYALGSMLSDAKTYLEIPEVFAVTAVTVVLSLLFEMLIKAVARRTENKKGGVADVHKDK